MIRHMVVFKLHHAKKSIAEQNFLLATQKLAAIPGVTKFEILKQASQKNTFDFGISMVFLSAREYETYNQHRDHQIFIEQFWKKGVSNFLEIDLSPLPATAE